MLNLPIGIQTRSLRLPLRRAIEAAGRLGADGVQIDLRSELPLADCSRSALRQVRKLLDDQRLGVSSVAFPTRRGFAEPHELDRRLAAAQQAMSVGAELGARVLVTRFGPVPAADDGEIDPAAEAALTALATHGDRVGARLALRTGADDAKALATLLDQLPEGIAGVDFHPADLLRHGGSPAEALALLGGRNLHLSAADAVHDLAARTVVDVPLGRGSVDFPELLAGLEPHDYHGWITVEANASGDPLAELDAAVEFLRTVIRDG